MSVLLGALGAVGSVVFTILLLVEASRVMGCTFVLRDIMNKDPQRPTPRPLDLWNVHRYVKQNPPGGRVTENIDSRYDGLRSEYLKRRNRAWVWAGAILIAAVMLMISQG